MTEQDHIDNFQRALRTGDIPSMHGIPRHWFTVDTTTVWNKETGEVLQRISNAMHAAILRTKEDGIRKALVALGWTPPGVAPPADLLRRLQTHAEDHGGNLRRPFGFFTHDYDTIKTDARLAGEYARKQENRET